jgi:hypothetical protein
LPSAARGNRQDCLFGLRPLDQVARAGVDARARRGLQDAVGPVQGLVPFGLRKNGVLVFNNESLENVDQATLFDGEDD